MTTTSSRIVLHCLKTNSIFHVPNAEPMCPIPLPMPPPKPPPKEREHKMDYTKNRDKNKPPSPHRAIIKCYPGVRMQVWLRTTYPFQKNLQILDSLADRCDQSRGPFHQFQTCTCLKTGGKVISHQLERPEQNLTSDLTWHSSSHVSSSKTSHVAHVIHAAKIPTTHPCQKQYGPLLPHLSTRHPRLVYVVVEPLPPPSLLIPP